jgi:hypothetical protein
MAIKYQSNDPLKDALAKVTADNVELITALRIAKGFANIGDVFVGFEGKDKKNQYFQLRVDYDPIKKGHVNVMINGSERHEYCGETYDWYVQVLDNINGGSYCDVSRNNQKMWQTAGQEKNNQYIEGMKKYMRRYFQPSK